MDVEPAATPSHGIHLIAGATSDSGAAVVRVLAGAGLRVLAVSRDAARLDRLRAQGPDVDVAVADLTDMAAVARLHAILRAQGATVAGVVHLVGGWRRSQRGIVDQTEEDWRFLETSLTSLRMVSREFDEEIAADPNGRFISVSSTALKRPRSTSASYAALKAAAEAWVLAVGDGFRGTAAAATIIAATSLAGRESDLATLVLDIIRSPAATVNAQRIVLG